MRNRHLGVTGLLNGSQQQVALIGVANSKGYRDGPETGSSSFGWSDRGERAPPGGDRYVDGGHKGSDAGV